MRTINKHIIHCSASTIGDVKHIRQWHLARGWNDVGYHFVIRKDGEIEIGRPLNIIGAHCAGYNYESIGTCLIGQNQFSSSQFKALQRLHAMLREIFPHIKAYPHNYFNKHKTCPNFDVYRVLEAEE